VLAIAGSLEQAARRLWRLEFLPYLPSDGASRI